MILKLIIEFLIMVPFVFILFSLISFSGTYFRYPNIINGKRVLKPSKEALIKALGTGKWAIVLYLIYEVYKLIK